MGDRKDRGTVVNIADSNWSGADEDGGRWKRLGRLSGGTRLGCTLEEIRPGGRPAHYHYHVANEEALYVLDGEGTLATPDGEQAIEPGDYVAFPLGEAGAHAVENTADEVLSCLFFSTMNEPDIVVYPATEEFQLVSGGALGHPQEKRTIEGVSPSDFSVNGHAPDGRRGRIANVAEIEAIDKSPKGQGFKRQQLTSAVAGERLGCSVYTLSQGAKSWRYHYHAANEEAMFVLDGRATLRLGGETAAIRKGDYISLPVGEAGAHRVVNDSGEDVRYLCVSTMIEPDVAVYPDANMVGLFLGAPPGAEEDDFTMHRYLDLDAEVDYWEGER